MTFLDHEKQEINCRVVYYGPPLAGKTTNFLYLHEKTGPKHKGKLVSLVTETDRTLFFDFLSQNVEKIDGYQIRFHLYTVPGAVFYDASRELILKGVDGVVFVADSQPERRDANLELLWNLESNLRKCGFSLSSIPYVLQLNKRDRPGVVPANVLIDELMRKNEPVFEAVAWKGIGVFETFHAVSKQILTGLQKNGFQHEDRIPVSNELPEISSFEVLLTALKNENCNIRSWAADKFGALGDQSAVEPLIKALDDRYGIVRYSILEALKKIGSRKAIPSVRQILKRDVFYLRAKAVEVLAHLSQHDSLEEFIELLQDKNEKVCYQAILALDILKDKKALQPLIDEIFRVRERRSLEVCTGAIRAVGNLRDEQAVKPLIEALATLSPGYTNTLIEALEKIGCEHELSAVELALENVSKQWKFPEPPLAKSQKVRNLVNRIFRPN